ncbi:MAG: universal stress protein [Deltaproteobacteria bacterium]|nr:universal stress protein [Deltaproteobacteria bacterium]MBW2105474.1 universal stress protein [Deltaproteobacteria bacterium]MCD6265140.1 universal stress protein [Deltaproteobacteria bacterium]
MLLSIKNILYATDLSKNSAFAFRYAITLANALDAKITILYILPMVDSAMEIPIITQMGEDRYYQLREERSREVIEGIKTKLYDFSQKELKGFQGESDLVSSILVHEGDAVDEILKTTEKIDSDIIILGAHGKGILSHTFLGTVPDKLLRRSRVPVLVVPIPKGATDADL